ncbi:MAG: hypothetical protein ACREGI_04970, partial [Candidatus Levyibacteriota bacterium]
MAVLAAEVLAHIGPIPITNTLITTGITDVIIVTGLFFLNKNITTIPGVLQNIMEFAIDGFYNLTVSI